MNAKQLNLYIWIRYISGVLIGISGCSLIVSFFIRETLTNDVMFGIKLDSFLNIIFGVFLILGVSIDSINDRIFKEKLSKLKEIIKNI